SSLPKMRVFCFYTTTNPAVSRVFASYQGAKLEFLIFRFLMGAGVGIDMPVALSFISEFSNVKTKSRNVNLWQGFWYIATVSSALLAFIFFYAGVGNQLWRWCVGFGGVFALVVLVMRYFYMNESPMWAAENLPLADTAKILERTYKISVRIEGDGDTVPIRNPRIPASILFSNKYRGRSILAMTISGTQAMQYFAIGFYIPVISTYIFGTGMVHSLLGTLIFNLFGIIGGFGGAYLSSRFGTRKLAIWGYVVAGLSLLFAGLTNGNIPALLGVIPIAIFIFSHSVGPGAQGKTMAALSYPTSIRALGTGGAEAASRVGSIIGFFFFPILLSAAGLSVTLIALTACPLVGWLACIAIRWEPNGQDIEHEVVMPAYSSE
uniref:MFS transporter n=1 Tax=Alicyclobacillus suci TaxID=2816080 RepID=UPI001A8FD641